MTLRLPALAAATALLWGAPVLAEELTPRRLAEIQHAEEMALKKVQSEFGNRKPSELSTRERRDFIRKQNEALNKVHGDLKVDVKSYARTLATQTRTEREAFDKAKKALADDTKPSGSGVEIIGADPEGGLIEIGRDGAPASESVIEVGKDGAPASDDMIVIPEDNRDAPAGNVIEIRD
ncbi:MAG TPA: hypothetical protein VK013_15875 [Myxococcaceae bacterium]|nr:hypothetical protein [Myxococcaceae bacterium]